MLPEVDQYSLFIRPVIECKKDVYETFTCNNGGIDGFLKADAFLSHVVKEASTSLIFIK